MSRAHQSDPGQCGAIDWRPSQSVRVFLADPDFRASECLLKFVLTYEGELKTGSRKAARKHAIRRKFHRQLRRLWEVNPLLANWSVQTDVLRYISARDWIQSQVAHVGRYRFVPLITKALCVECALEFSVLRPTDRPGHVTDIDNQIKVLVDALKMPRNMEDLGDNSEPDDSECPFYVLIEDDRLIVKVSSINDELLQPLSDSDIINPSDVRVMLNVYIRPQLPLAANVIFFSDDPLPWDHKYDEGMPESLSNLSNSQLQARATQCIMRMRAMAQSFASWNSSNIPPRVSREDWDRHTAKLISDSSAMQDMWRRELHPKAYAIKREMQRRVYGEGPYPKDRGSVAIDSAMLAGPSPLTDGANELEGLARQLS